ncbi:MAG: hypothetical protein N2738_03370, partial [Thermodesulfovibrionales bacterium]|nr:hypothetical protein [Thermodesulfovibrionales bacterium]
MSRWQIDQNCPQCGGPATIEETDRLFKCNYCKVSLFIIPKEHFKYYLIPKLPETEHTYYFPYWRLKGTAYTCSNSTVTKQIVERSYRAVDLNYIPFTLGYRTQTLKMRFVPTEHEGKFITHEELNRKYIFSIDEGDAFKTEMTPIYHRAFIGDSITIIYSPYQLKGDELYDAILNRKIELFDKSQIETLKNLRLSEGWQVKFLPTLCPNCGWDLSGQGDTVVFSCTNCDSLWDVTGSSLNKVNYLFCGEFHRGVKYLPFWRLDVDFNGLVLKSYSDLFKLANLPKVYKQKWNDIKAYFWAPAFKVTPEVFLRLTRQFTLTEETFKLEEINDYLNLVETINLSRVNALESVKITLANISSDRKNFYPKLKEIDVSLNEACIVYV